MFFFVCIQKQFDIRKNRAFLNKFICVIGKNENQMRILKAAMKEWEQQTCIRFTKAGREENYAEFAPGEG